MNINDIVVGQEYKVSNPTARSRGSYLVKSVDMQKLLVSAKHKLDSHDRTFQAEEIIEPTNGRTKSVKREIECEIVGEPVQFGDVQIVDLEVSYLPPSKRRGRKPKNG